MLKNFCANIQREKQIDGLYASLQTMQQKFLVIQTAFIGDVVLATGIIEKLHDHFPGVEIDLLVRHGNEGLLKDHPFLHEVLVWNKKENKLLNLWKLLFAIRRRKYDKVINIQRFASTGFLTAFSSAKEKTGFDKNPFSRLFTTAIIHTIGDDVAAKHEIERNHELIKSFTDTTPAKPKLYPSVGDYNAVQQYKQQPYISISPASVWFTKQYPKEKWVSLINKIPYGYNIYLLGAPGDNVLAGEIMENVTHHRVASLCGKLNFLQSAALMKDAVMNYVNDSAPMHFASAVNAPVTAVYCSTIPAFGYGPLSDKSYIIEATEKLSCRPCGLHGKKACPQGHFNCAHKITDEQLLQCLTT
jgi:heptosyltransferase-2